MSLLPSCKPVRCPWAQHRVSLSIQSIFAQLKQAYLKGQGFIFHSLILTLAPNTTPETLIINADNICFQVNKFGCVF